jgi:enoyl-CoA hydratase/carnithine racemase
MKDFTLEVTACGRDESLRAIVVTGAREKAFIAGADIDERCNVAAWSASFKIFEGGEDGRCE